MKTKRSAKPRKRAPKKNKVLAELDQNQVVTASRIVTKEIQFVDQNGAVRGIVGTVIHSGEPRLDLLSKEGHVQLSVGLSADGAANVALYRSDGSLAIGLAVPAMGPVGMGIHGRNAEELISIGIDVNGDAVIDNRQAS